MFRGLTSLERKYNEYCDLDVVKRFFFWGIFRSRKRLTNYVGYKPSLFIDGTLDVGGETVRGKIVEFDVPDDIFYIILGRLAIIESEHYVLSTRYQYAVSKGIEYNVMVYIQAQKMKHLGYY